MDLKFPTIDMLSQSLYFFNDNLYKLKKASQHEQQMKMLSNFQKNLNSDSIGNALSWGKDSVSNSIPRNSPMRDMEIYSKFKEKLGRKYEAAVKTLGNKVKVS